MKKTIQAIQEQVETGVNFVVSAEIGLGKVSTTQEVLNKLNKKFERIHTPQSEDLVAEFTNLVEEKNPEIVLLDEVDRLYLLDDYEKVILLAKQLNVQLISFLQPKEKAEDVLFSESVSAAWVYIEKYKMPIVTIDKNEAFQEAVAQSPLIADFLKKNYN